MKGGSIYIKRFLLLSFLALPGVLFVQQKFGKPYVEPLAGAVTQPSKPYISMSGWLDGSYQKESENWINASFGFRPWFIRLHNQIAYSLFDKAKANGVIVGKNEVLMEQSYIDAHFGSDALPEDSISHAVDKLRNFADSLAKKQRHFIYVFAPGKASFYPEYIPENLRVKRQTTNYAMVKQALLKAGITTIDFKQSMEAYKGVSAAPLVPKYGIHWSIYASMVAADTLVRRVEKLTGKDLPEVKIGPIQWLPAQGTDYDIGRGLNIFCPPGPDTLGYPPFDIVEGDALSEPKVLVIADSYFWSVFNLGVGRAFGQLDFWYYHQELHRHGATTPIVLSDQEKQQLVYDYDVVILLNTEPKILNFGWGLLGDIH